MDNVNNQNILVKKCSQCGEIKELSQYKKDKTKKYGVRSECTQCQNKPEKVILRKEKHKKWYNENIEKIKEKGYIHRQSEDVKQRMRNVSRKSYLKNREKVLDKAKIRLELKRDEILQQSRERYLKTNYKETIKKRRNQDPNAMYRTKYGNVLRLAIKRNSTTYFESVLKCTIPEFKKYIQGKFYGDMSWFNHGILWDLDHIIPCNAFDLSIEEQRLKCFHYTNYQPLLKHENKQKAYKYYEKIKL